MDKSAGRLYFIDWIRVLAFILLIFFHSAMPFVTYNWEVKNAEKSDGLFTIVTWFHQWRLPLLFFISGAGIHFSLQKRTVFRFILERLRRLLIPLVFAMLFTIPFQVYVEFLQKGRIHTDYFTFYPSVWKLVPYPEGSLTWSHMWFIVYLICFLFLLLPVFLMFKYKPLDLAKKRLSAFIAKPFLIVLLFIPAYIIYKIDYLKYPEQGSLVNDWFVFNSSLAYLLSGYLLAGSYQFWDTCEKYRWAFLSIAITGAIYLVVGFYTPVVHLPKIYNRNAEMYFLIDAIHIWSVIIAIAGFAKKYLKNPSEKLTYLNEAVFPFFIIHQTIIVATGYWIVKLDASIFLKFFLLVTSSCIAIFFIYHFIIKRTILTRILYGMKW